MKKTFLLFGMMLSSFVFSQEVVLTADNFKNKDDQTKDYVVLDSLNGSSKDLFDSAKIFIQSTYKGSKDSNYSEVDGKSLTIDIQGSKEIREIFNMSGGNLYNTVIRYVLKFKDGKMMIQPSFVKLDNITDGDDVGLIKSCFLCSGIYKKDGKPNGHEKVINIINNDANNFIQEVKNALTKKEDW